MNWIPQKIKDNPFRAFAAGMLALTLVVYLFGPDRVAGWIESLLGIAG